MKKISEKSLGSLEALRSVGVIEESFVVMGMPITVRNLTPTESEQIVLQSGEAKTEVSYMTAYQLEHVAYGIVAVGDLDLRGVEFIEIQQTNPKTGQVQNTLVEKSKWLKTKILPSWGKEVIYTIFLKVMDAVELATREAKKGVVFIIPEESPEEKLRRLLSEAVAVLQETPDYLGKAALKDYGLMLTSTEEELKNAADKLAAIRADEEAQAESAQAPTPPHPVQSSVPSDEEEASGPRVVRGLNEEELAALRDTMGKRQPAHGVSPTAQAAPSRAQVATAQAEELGLPDAPSSGDIATVSRSKPIDFKALEAIADPSPQGGLNPRFRRPE